MHSMGHRSMAQAHLAMQVNGVLACAVGAGVAATDQQLLAGTTAMAAGAAVGSWLASADAVFSWPDGCKGLQARKLTPGGKVCGRPPRSPVSRLLITT
jgi:hypothetical protein